MMRTTLYDSFGAGWRVDRLFQMIGRDPLGFLKAWFVSFIGGAVCVAYTVLMAMVGSVIALGGIAAVVSTGYAYHYGHAEYALQQLLAWGAGPFMLLVLLVIAAIFVYGVISVAMQLVAVNAMGQWFCRFEVNRWGVSAAPLPDGVPVRPDGGNTWSPNGGAPTRPAGGAGSGAGATDAGSYWDNDDPVPPVAPVAAAAADEPIVAEDVTAIEVEESSIMAADEEADQGDHDQADGPIPLGPISTE